MKSLRHIVSFAASAIAPRYCLMCGELVPSQDGDIPLCPSCAASLEPISEPRCGRCGRALHGEIELCGACKAQKNPEKTGEDLRIFPIYLYRSLAGDLVRSYKNERRDSLASFFSDILAPIIEIRWPDSIIVPVPPRREKMLQEGWDQVEAMAHRLEKRGFEVRRVLERSSEAQQKRLSRELRRENARKGYALSSLKGVVVPEKALLLDDVVTTGATLRACAEILSANGSRDIAALALAAD